jgi:hypothetical protein
MADTGRPTKYQEDYAHQAYKLCLLGFTNKQLAEYFEVVESTIYEWKLEFPSFSEALKRGKYIADGEVAASLYARAMGYEHPDDDIKVVDGQIVITPIIKRYPPDSTSMIFWLKNRQSKLWRDKPEDDGEKTQNPITVVIQNDSK